MSVCLAVVKGMHLADAAKAKHTMTEATETIAHHLQADAEQMVADVAAIQAAHPDIPKYVLEAIRLLAGV
jgi:hypothetical protein